MSNIISFPHETTLVRESMSGSGVARRPTPQRAVGDYEVLGRPVLSGGYSYDPVRMASVPYRPGQSPSARERLPQDLLLRGASVPNDREHRILGHSIFDQDVSVPPSVSTVTDGLGITEYRVKTRLRLTNRGRVVLVGVIALLLTLVALSGILFMSGSAIASSAPSQGLTYITVNSGDSLWGLAQRLAPSSDPRDVISDILSLNRLDSSDLEAGQELAIPTQYMDGKDSADGGAGESVSG
ncbi:hypothetical protein GCM10022198_20450 [Klugiella xanthotipulae]|uniref:LysM domain-containing protein n=1 Tax=Klugiella xanthotipulae TaxID=244735 RepID=A0A543HXP4_9MICO|nr:LysM peptidoglycan-binding domain-containing protein [Klugiella xanthotipulae]TQM63133.1 LysM domain-containing protein [Klugiella xanthotipulae]